LKNLIINSTSKIFPKNSLQKNADISKGFKIKHKEKCTALIRFVQNFIVSNSIKTSKT